MLPLEIYTYNDINFMFKVDENTTDILTTISV